MKNIGPFGLEIRVFAGLCGLAALLLSLVLFGWGFFGSLIFGIIVGVIVAIYLMSQGQENGSSGTVASGTTGVSAGNAPGRNSADGGGASAEPSDVSAPASVETAAESAEVFNAAETVDPQIKTHAAMKAEEEKAVTAVDPQITTDEVDTTPKVKTTTTLAGEDELASRKGEWKYEGDAADETPAAAPKSPETPAPDLTATADAADKDYDGDGVIEGENEGAKPKLLAAAREGGADNLKEIKGVGPKMETMLNEMGVYHFDQVARWSANEVAWVDANLKGFKGRVSRDGWVDQAKILAAGGDTAFSKKVEKGGVY